MHKTSHQRRPVYGLKPSFSLWEKTNDLFGGKTLLHGDALTLLMKTLLSLTQGQLSDAGF